MSLCTRPLRRSRQASDRASSDATSGEVCVETRSIARDPGLARCKGQYFDSRPPKLASCVSQTQNRTRQIPGSRRSMETEVRTQT